MISGSRRFAAAFLAVAGLVAAYAAWVELRLGGEALTVAVEDYGQAAAAAAAAVACSCAAWRTSAATRRGWALLALSGLSWFGGEIVWAIYEVDLGVVVPFPSPADVLFLGAIPLAAAAILTFPSTASSTVGRLRALLDAAIVASSLMFIAWPIGVADAYAHARFTDARGVLLLAYPTGDILLLALLAMGLRRASSKFRPVVVTFIAAFAANLLADSSFAYLSLHNAYGILGNISDTGWFAGYLLIGAAAVRPSPRSLEAATDGSVEMWQLALPWVGALAVIVDSLWIVLTGQQVGLAATWIGCAMGVAFVGSQVITLSDTTRLLARSKRTEAQLAERTSLLNEVILRAPLGIIRVGTNVRILDANPTACSMLRAPAVALIGTAVAEYFAPEEFERMQALFVALRRGQADNLEAEGEVRRADKSTMWVRWNVTVVRTRNGEIDYFLNIMEDITTKHENEQAALANLAALERLNRLKSEFMSMVSHEFRTALTGIQGYSEVLNTEDVSSAEVKEFAGDINSEALRLNRMITEMLDLDRIESGRIQLHIETLDMNGLVSEVVERARMTTSKHQIVLRLDPTAGAVDVDRDRLTQVLSNLLSNAVKYSPDGGEIVVGSRMTDGQLEVSVRDHGKGIPPEFIKRIFGRYERYEGSGQTQVVGTGLGLAIAQQIIQLHKGRIWVESALGQGAEFHFVVPVAGAGKKVA